MMQKTLTICTACTLAEQRAPKLRHLVILVTERCNSNCRLCNYGGKTTAEQAEMSTGTILSLISEAASLGCTNIILSGGEPLLRPDITELFHATCDLGIESTCALCTNGSMIDKPIAELLAEANPAGRVVLSLDGHNADLHDSIRGFPGSFDKVLLAVDHLGTAFGNTDHIGINTTINSRNADSIPDIIDFVASLKIRSHKLVPAYCNDNGERSSLSGDELEKLFSQSLELKHHAENKAIELVNLSPYAMVATGGCHVPSFLSYVDSQGRIYGCNVAKEGFGISSTPPIGLFSSHGDLEKVWYSEEYRSFRTAAHTKSHRFCQTACPDITAHTMNFLHGPCGSCINHSSDQS